MSDGVMYIHRSAPSSNYTVVRNQIFEAGLGVEALGLLTYLISRPAEWIVSQEQLRKLFGLGRDRLTRIIKELETAGYIKREQRRDPDTKSFGKMRFYVYDEPVSDVQEEASDDAGQANEEPRAEKPLTGQPSTGDPNTGEPQTAIGMVENNNNIKKNNIINTPLPPSGDRQSAAGPMPEKRKRRFRRKQVEETPIAEAHFIERGTEPWKAWAAYEGKEPIALWNGKLFKYGRVFRSKWPPGHERAELSQGYREGQGG